MLRRLRFLAAILPALSFLVSTAFAADFYAAPAGSAAASGSEANPWDIATAFAQPAAVKPGDTIWLRGGDYVMTAGLPATLTGTPAAPITVRSYPGERAAIIGNQTSGISLEIKGAWTVYRDFEFKSTLTAHPSGTSALALNGNHNSVINSVVHDTTNNAPHGNGNLIYGCLFYYNGDDGSGLSHAMYIQNDDPNQPAAFEENIIFASYAFGVHAYAGGVGLLNGLHFIGNVSFINGTAQTVGDAKDNILIGGVNGQQGTLLKENMGWSYSSQDRSVALGKYANNNNVDITLQDNYFVGTTLFYNQWQSIAMTGNTFYGPVTLDGVSMTGNFPSNTYLASAPVQNKIFVRSNRYEVGRANIIVYNWSNGDSAAVDVSGVLALNAAYEVRNAQNYFGAPIKTGTYTGGTITLPLTGLSMAQPVTAGLVEAGEITGKKFNVFVLRRTDAGAAAKRPNPPGNLRLNN